MGHVAFLCPDPQMWSMPGTDIIKTVPIADCLNCSLTRNDRDCQWDFADLYARQEDGYNELFSPSRFNGCDRELWLRANNDYWTDPAEQTYRVRGTATHAALEVEHSDIIVEARVYRTLEGAVDHEGKPAVVSVKPDKVYPGLGVIHDDKTWKYLPRGGPGYATGQVHPIEIKDAWRLQLSIGAWVWAKPDFITDASEPSGLRFVDPITITSGQITVRDGSTQLRMRDIELFPFDELEEYMRGRVKELNAVRLGLEPDYVREEDRWKCKTCPVRYLCGIPKDLYDKPKEAKTSARGAEEKETKSASNRRRRSN